MTFGAEPSKIDCRDFRLSNVKKAKLPLEYLPSRKLPNVKNQRSTSSCVAHTISSILEWNNHSKVPLSTQWIYACKKLLKDSNDNVGMSIKQGCAIAVKYGDVRAAMCLGNDEYPECYEKSKELLQSEPILKLAYKNHAEYYIKLSSEKEIKYAVTKELLPILSLKWFSDFKYDSDGKLSTSYSGKMSYHAVFVYGYNAQGFLCQNSWGKEFGVDGRFIIPFSIAKKLITDSYALIDCPEDEIHKPHANTCAFFVNLINEFSQFFVNLSNKLFK